MSLVNGTPLIPDHANVGVRSQFPSRPTLIVLAERPIKVGDLVVVGGEEGYARKISVRSTEVETSERARVLIPNSCFITEKVKNWTLRDNIRRVVIPISVGYGCRGYFHV